MMEMMEMMEIIKIIALLFLIIIIGHLTKLTDNITRPKFDGKVAGNYIVLKCIVPNKDDEGGFAWHLHHVQCLLYLCKEMDKIPIVYFNRGYYYSPKHGNNWFTHYFQEIADKKLTDKIVKYGDNNGYTIIDNIPLPTSKLPYLYNNSTFQRFIRSRKTDFNWSYKYIIPNKHLSDKLELFRHKYFSNKFIIGIHYRGTDKFANNGDNEDLKSNKHLSYNKVIIKIRQYILDLQKNEENVKNGIVIFVASDEEPFINTMRLHFNNIVSYDTSRSYANTSNILLDTIDCKTDTNTEKCRELKVYQNLSIHRGNNHIPPYKKGEDAVMDIWLLSSCNVMFKTQAGNFSSQPFRINNKLQVLEVSA